jgi:hypothetical protein
MEMGEDSGPRHGHGQGMVRIGIKIVCTVRIAHGRVAQLLGSFLLQTEALLLCDENAFSLSQHNWKQLASHNRAVEKLPGSICTQVGALE